MDLNRLEQESLNGIIMRTPPFITVYNSFIRNPKISANCKILYLYLSGYNGKGEIFPSYSRISSEIGWSRQRVCNTIKELEKIGGVYVVNRICKKTKKKASNLYFIPGILITGDFDDFLDTVKEAYPEKVKYI